MFETLLDRSAAGEALDRMTAAAREENAAGARRLEAIADLYEIRAPGDDTERLNWVIDGYAGLGAEVAVGLGISRSRADAQLKLAIALRDRLPAVATVYLSGEVDYRLICTVITRTDLVDDPARLAMVDRAVAAEILGWVRLSGPAQEQRIDEVIARADPVGVRTPTPARDKRRVDIEPLPCGLADIWARVDATAAAALDALLDTMADGVCADDPRTKDQRRSDAILAIGMGTALACLCGSGACPAADPGRPATASRLVIHVVASPATVAGDPHAPGYLPGYGLLPADQVATLAPTATIREVQIPPDAAEPGYRPGTALAEFVRTRDLTCRFPGCAIRAEYCDIDHTVPWPAGPTHPSNLKCLCRFHHLLKTFHDGWTDTQYPDGTVEWRTPTGEVHTTRPEGAHWFPHLATPTGVPAVAPVGQPNPLRALKMPRRTRSRAEEHTQRVAEERGINRERINRHDAERRLLAWQLEDHLYEVAALDEEPIPF
ncbi:HNH endonuclease signature motif containing protein [Mycolicibacterium fluoranthenivorans]|uniref:HNH nuclease domain-containing protein n=1 Tax=Mycolicibacterium fluoranthenivorans TaxID=258505 RepID=A0A1G4W4R3_9MYCO|nr:HNH endonuclease signature motif containing protein [Mycolicibacterium fluoranthenivorans]SCX16739.1 protein of unknown function [Mycolicibacterium fluoranthenivorans]